MIEYDDSRKWVKARARDGLTDAFAILHRLVERDVNEWNSLYEKVESMLFTCAVGGSPEEREFRVVTTKKPNVVGPVSKWVMFTQTDFSTIQITTNDNERENPLLDIAVVWNSEEVRWDVRTVEGELLDLGRVSQLVLEDLLFPS